ncbi:MAG: Methionine sulfoxide reductase [Phycisphaerales bacterium]|nr:Methionine sulfoxide reductase [Phycisphaerales bacterium]
MPRQPKFAIAALLLVGAVGVGAWAVSVGDPVPTIAAELRQGVSDGKNHAPYANLVRAELASVSHREVDMFAMPCFWAGEAHFGGQAGVYRTTPGYLGGKEVVRVEFDPAVTSRETLLAAPDNAATKPGGCRFDAAAIHASRQDPAFRPDTEFPAWYLRQTEGLKFIPMTPAQTARIDNLVHADQPYLQLLSPGQQALLKRVLARPDAGWTDFAGGDTLWRLIQQHP